jgi:hypothetical protein
MYEQVHSVASNRAIPTKVYLKRILECPAEPLRWGKNQPGMAASEEVTGWRLLVGKRVHAIVRAVAVAGAYVMHKLGFHKEVANWHVMPSAWVTQIVTATDWENFDALRIHPAARAEMQKIATMMRDARNASTPRELGEGGWHLPLVHDYEIVRAYEISATPEVADLELWMISAARVARVSLLKHGESRSVADELNKANELLGLGHMSPFDHPAQCLGTNERVANLRGFKSARKFIPNEDNFARLTNANG